MKVKPLIAATIIAFSGYAYSAERPLVPADDLVAPATLKMQSAMAESFYHTKLIRDFVQRLEVEQISIDLKTNSTPIKIGDIPTAVANGTIDLGEILLSGSQDFPLGAADSVPFVARSYEDARRLWGYQRPLIEQDFAAKGLRLLYVVPWPPQGMFTQKPVKTMRDLAGMQMRHYNQWTKQIAEYAKAVPVDVPNAGINAALKEGRINSLIISSASGAANRAWESLKYFYPINAWLPKNAVFINEDRFSNLTNQQRKSILNAAAFAEERGWRASEETLRESMAELRKNGMVIGEVSPDLDDELTRLGDRFAREWINKVGHRGNEIFLPYYTESLRN